MIEYARRAFDSVYLCKLLHSYGKLDGMDLGWTVDEDLWWPMTFEALQNISGAVWVECLDMENKYYFSDPAMMEYYRLCREYCRLFGVSLKQNPFMQKAEGYVKRLLGNLYSYGYGWTLHTRINHEWASGIVFGMDDQFDGYTNLIEALLEIFWFYETELEVLKKALSDKNEENTRKTSYKMSRPKFE